MKVLVTGGSGFIGRHVVNEAVLRGHDVTALSRSPRGVHSEAKLLHHDLRRRDGLREALRGFDGVVHCAALRDGSPIDLQTVNVLGTRHLLDALDPSVLRRFVVVSTLALYDFRALAVDSVLDEESPLITDFSDRHPALRAQSQREELVRDQDDPSVWSILRTGLVYGPDRMWFDDLGTKDTPSNWTFWAGDSLLPVTHVENCAIAALLAMEHAAAGGGTFNVVDDDLPTRRDYVVRLAAQEDSPPTITHVPWKTLKGRSARPGWLKRVLGSRPAPESGASSSGDVQALCKPLRFANDRAKSVLGWEPVSRLV